MRRAWAILATGVLAAMALAAPATASSTDRPFRGSTSGDVVFVEGGDYAECDEGYPGLGAEYAWHGEASHLGRVQVIGSHCASEAAAGTATMIAANGDGVSLAYEALEPCNYNETFTEAVCMYAGTVTGGTGRFDDASGSFTWTVMLEVTDTGVWPAKSYWTGELGY